MSARPLSWDIALGLLGLCALAAVPLPWTEASILLMLGPGLAHGAFDVQLASPQRKRFYLGYLGAALSAAILWWAVPTVALLLFLGLATWHLGEAELVEYPLDSDRKLAFISRGALLVLWPLGLRLPEAAPILEAMGVHAPPVSASLRALVLLGLLGTHFKLLSRSMSRRSLARELLSVLASLSLLSFLPLLEGFSIWFSLGHAGAHLHALRRRRPSQRFQHYFSRPAVAAWAVALLGVVCLAWKLGAQGAEVGLWAATFIGLGILTVPHMVLVALWHRPKRLPAVALGAARAS